MITKNLGTYFFIFSFILLQVGYSQGNSAANLYERCSVSELTSIDINTTNASERSGRVGVSCIGGISGYVDKATVPREMTFQFLDGNVHRVVTIQQDPSDPIVFSDVVDQVLDSSGRSSISQALRRAGVPRGARVRLMAAALSSNTQINNEPRASGNTVPLSEYLRTHRAVSSDPSYGLYPCQYRQKTILNLGRGTCGAGDTKICHAELSCMQLYGVNNVGNVRVSAACSADQYGLCPTNPMRCIADSNISLNPENQSAIERRRDAILMDANESNPRNQSQSKPVGSGAH